MATPQVDASQGSRPANAASAPPGKRLFVAGCAVLFLFSAVHMIPMCIAMFVEPTKPAEIEAKRAMAAVAVDIGPFHTTWAGLNMLLSASYSGLLFFVVALNVVALPAVVAHQRLRALATVNAIFAAILLAISLAYQFPPPALFSLIACVLFAGPRPRPTSAPSGSSMRARSTRVPWDPP